MLSVLVPNGTLRAEIGHVNPGATRQHHDLPLLQQRAGFRHSGMYAVRCPAAQPHSPSAPISAPLATQQAPPPYAPPASFAVQAPWNQHQYWIPAPRMRSFRWQVFIALALYFPFFLPGLIANIIWWNQARSLEAATGIAPRGKGCLTMMLVCAVIMMLISVGIAGIF
jgi:hypothetical protein